MSVSLHWLFILRKCILKRFHSYLTYTLTLFLVSHCPLSHSSKVTTQAPLTRAPLTSVRAIEEGTATIPAPVLSGYAQRNVYRVGRFAYTGSRLPFGIHLIPKSYDLKIEPVTPNRHLQNIRFGLYKNEDNNSTGARSIYSAPTQMTVEGTHLVNYQRPYNNPPVSLLTQDMVDELEHHPGVVRDFGYQVGKQTYEKGLYLNATTGAAPLEAALKNESIGSLLVTVCADDSQPLEIAHIAPGNRIFAMVGWSRNCDPNSSGQCSRASIETHGAGFTDTIAVTESPACYLENLDFSLVQGDTPPAGSGSGAIAPNDNATNSTVTLPPDHSTLRSIVHTESSTVYIRNCHFSLGDEDVLAVHDNRYSAIIEDSSFSAATGNTVIYQPFWADNIQGECGEQRSCHAYHRSPCSFARVDRWDSVACKNITPTTNCIGPACLTSTVAGAGAITQITTAGAGLTKASTVVGPAVAPIAFVATLSVCLGISVIALIDVMRFRCGSHHTITGKIISLGHSLFCGKKSQSRNKQKEVRLNSSNI